MSNIIGRKCTIIRDGRYGDDIILVRNSAIYDVVWLHTCVDHAQILTADGELQPTEGWYPADYFEGSDERLVMTLEDYNSYYNTDLTEDDVCDDDEWEEIADPYSVDDDDTLWVTDVTKTWMSYDRAKAVDIEHGINTDTIAFDYEEDDDTGWMTDDKVVIVDWELEHEQDYPNHELTLLYYLDNGKVVRKYSPFFSDQSRDYYRYVPYDVYLNIHNVESKIVESFGTLDEARQYVESQLKDAEMVDGDCSEDVYESSRVGHYEICLRPAYYGNDDEDDDDVPEVVWESDAFYDPYNM
jgi:hypothetical protein